jgi:curved DNA-binding protein
MDYYSTLGLQRGASDADIKKAYRSMAMKHHPDRGGDEKKFKEISQAYEFLSDPQKKQMIDMGVDPNQQHGGGQHHGGPFGFGQSPFEFHFGSGDDIHNIFSQFGFGGGGFRQQPRNKSFNINIELTLEEVLTGKNINAQVGVPGSPGRAVNISIPPGVEHGQQIKYDGMGDNSISNIRPGDLIINVMVRPHPVFRREGDSLIFEKSITVWDAIIGTSLNIQTIDGKNLQINVPAGTQPDTILSCRGEGLPNVRNRQRGNLLIKIKVDILRNLSQEQINKIKALRNDL